jgi:hypothetical protein
MRSGKARQHLGDIRSAPDNDSRLAVDDEDKEEDGKYYKGEEEDEKEQGNSLISSGERPSALDLMA